MNTMFSVYGPFNVPCYQGKAARTISDDNVKNFWKQHPSMAQYKGCYVFGIRAGKGFTPGYAGKATRSFKNEAFGSHKLARYQQFLADYQRGTPVIFFVVYPSKKGKVNVRHIEELETFLIQNGVRVNPDIMNVKGTKVAKWGIKGVLRCGKGKVSQGVNEFRRLLKLYS